MSKYILIDQSGEILGGITSNDDSLILDKKVYVDISDHPQQEHIMHNMDKYKVNKGKISLKKV